MIRANRWHFSWLVLMGFLTVSGAYAQRPLLEITSPSNESLAPEGQTLTITVSADPSVRNIYVITQSPLPEVRPTSSPTEFTLTLPTNIPPGLYQITAVGAAAAELAASAPVQIDVERQDTPRYLVARPTFLTLLSVGDKMPFDILGMFAAAGGALSVTKSTYTKYTSNNTQVVTVEPYGFVTAEGPGETTVLVQYGSLSTTFRVTVEQPRPER